MDTADEVKDISLSTSVRPSSRSSQRTVESDSLEDSPKVQLNKRKIMFLREGFQKKVLKSEPAFLFMKSSVPLQKNKPPMNFLPLKKVGKSLKYLRLTKTTQIRTYLVRTCPKPAKMLTSPNPAAPK